MHMADALLSAPVAVGMGVATAAALGVSLRALRKEGSGASAKIPVMAVMAAFVFAGQMVNYAIPGTGASGHLCGGMLLAALLGPFGGFVSMVMILAIQALFFADGGLLALGANCWNMAFYGCFVGYFAVWRPWVASAMGRVSPRGMRKRIVWASMGGAVMALQLGAFSVVVETLLSGVTELPFAKFVLLMQPIHVAIGVVEGAITAAVLLFVHEARPELLKAGVEQKRGGARGVLTVLAACTLVLGGGVALLASEKPDGLEWAIEGTHGEEEIRSTQHAGGARAAAVQKATSFMPEYGFAKSDSRVGTSVAGVVGSVAVAGGIVLVWLVGRGCRRVRKGARL